MSFSGDVKRELTGQTGKGRHCQIAELTAIITMCGGVSVSAQDRASLRIQTENRHVAEKACALLRKAFSVKEMYGIGDHYNDLPLLESVDHPYTLSHAPEGVKDAAEGIVRSVSELLDRI